MPGKLAAWRSVSKGRREAGRREQDAFVAWLHCVLGCTDGFERRVIGVQRRKAFLNDGEFPG